MKESCLTLCSLDFSLQVDTLAEDRAPVTCDHWWKRAQARMSLVEHNSSNCSNWVSVLPERVALLIEGDFLLHPLGGGSPPLWGWAVAPAVQLQQVPANNKTILCDDMKTILVCTVGTPGATPVPDVEGA